MKSPGATGSWAGAGAAAGASSATPAPGAATAAPGGVARGAVRVEHLLVRTPDGLARLDPEFVHQRAAQRAVGGQRVRPATGAVQRQDQLPVEGLPQRVLRREQRQLGGQTLVPAQFELRVEPPLERLQPEFREPGGLR
ncbi:hypothetical protein GCM10025734_22690 [Kitasatospora paranensis]